MIHRTPMTLFQIQLLLLLVIGQTGYSQEVPATDPHPDDSKVILINGTFPGEDWEFFSGKKDAKLDETWSITPDQEPDTNVIICRGQPFGYIRTKKKYANFEFGLEWRFPKDENGNSGVLLFTSGEDQIWPTAMQVQLHQPVAGSIFPTQGAKSKNELRNVEMLSRPVNQWNKCFIRCVNGTVYVTINDTEVGEVLECEPKIGSIALQSEGSEVHFRRIWIRELAPDSKPVATSKHSTVEKTVAIRPVGFRSIGKTPVSEMRRINRKSTR